MKLLKKKLRKIKKILTDKALNLTPTAIRDFYIRNQVLLDYNPPSNLKFKLAQTKDELEQSYKLLYNAYVSSGSMKPDSTGMRITNYHILPSTSVLIAKLDDVVIATLSIFRYSPFGLPVAKIYDISRFANSTSRFAEISSLALKDEYKSDQRTILFGLLKYFHEYSTLYFGIDVNIITIKPFRKHFYESLLGFKPLENRVAKNYQFSNGATVIAEYLELSTAVDQYKQIYNHKPDDKNLYKYFVEAKISNFEFPNRDFHSISDPVLNPELMRYFFIEKVPVIPNLSGFELAILQSIYPSEEYSQIFEPYMDRIKAINFSRLENRFETKIRGLIKLSDIELNQMITVYNASSNGLMINSFVKLVIGQTYSIKLNVSSGKISNISAILKWTNGMGMYGLEIQKADSNWEAFISYLNRPILIKKVG